MVHAAQQVAAAHCAVEYPFEGRVVFAAFRPVDGVTEKAARRLSSRSLGGSFHHREMDYDHEVWLFHC